MSGSLKPSVEYKFDLRSVTSTHWQWLVHADIERIFAKGFNEVFLRMPSSYYEYIYKCKSAEVLLHYGGAIRTWASGQFKALLSGRDPLGDLAAVEDLDRGVDAAEADAPMLALPDISQFVPQELRAKAAPPSPQPAPFIVHGLHADGQPMSIRWSRSHTSGLPRLFVQCPHPDHHHCEQYRFLHHFDNVRDTKIWLAAWCAESIFFENRPDHYQHRPSDAALAEARAIILD